MANIPPQTPIGQGPPRPPGPPQVNQQMPPQQQGQNPAASQNLNQIVLEYLSKKGFSRSELALRKESENVDDQGRPIHKRVEDQGARKYKIAFHLLLDWLNDAFDLYKEELNRLKWPVFVYSLLDLASDYYPEAAAEFFETFREQFQRDHAHDLRGLATIRLPHHVQENSIAKLYRTGQVRDDMKYRLSLTETAYYNLVAFLEQKVDQGGSVILGLLNRLDIKVVNRSVLGNERSLAAILNKKGPYEELPPEDEGIPGHNPGSANTGKDAPNVLARLALGPAQLEDDLATDVRYELQDEDTKNPPTQGQQSLTAEFDQMIKKEETDDQPPRENIPLPPSMARDVALTVQKVKDFRDRVKLTGRTGGVGPGVSVVMYTFHNTYDGVTSIDFSGDNKLVAVGTDQSYIRVWTIDGSPIQDATYNANGVQTSPPSSSRRLIGHSGPVYAVSFSPSIDSEGAFPDSAPTNSQYLLSCSADQTIRLWSLETWQCLVVYKGHCAPVWDVKWGPFGYYFASGGHDRAARIWATKEIAPLRILVGHDQDVDSVSWHPNNAYLFTCSIDKSVRMWDINRGNAVRMFTGGHSSPINSLSCSPNGKILASADEEGKIILWDLTTGRRIKILRGHGPHGIWSMDWSVESTVLVSGGADGTVRIWDAAPLPSDGAAAGNLVNGKVDGAGVKVEGGSAVAGTAGANGAGTVGSAAATNAAAAASASGASGAGAGGLKKGKKKEVVVSPEQIGAFPTKQTPVLKVKFTSMNLVLAGGKYLPGQL